MIGGGFAGAACARALRKLQDSLDVTLVASHELRPGEEIRVEQGEIVPVDLVVTRGEATVLPWLGASSTTPRREGVAIVAGARP